MGLLCMNCIKKYNNKMGGFGIDDKSRNDYMIYFWVRKRKWWWCILFWDVGVILTNAYIIWRTLSSTKSATGLIPRL